LDHFDVAHLVVITHLPDKFAVVGGWVHCVDGLITFVDTLFVDTLRFDTLRFDTLRFDALRPRYRIVPDPRPQINDIVFDDTRIYQVGVHPSKQNFVVIPRRKDLRKGVLNQ
jgi:hypothetical protein